jgi:hypothetical protein
MAALALPVGQACRAGERHQRRRGGGDVSPWDRAAPRRRLRTLAAARNPLKSPDEVGRRLIPRGRVLLDAFRTMSRTAGGRSLATVAAGSGVSPNALMVSSTFDRANGLRPVAVSQSMTPSEKMSVRESTDAPRISSGDMYAGVPTTPVPTLRNEPVVTAD